MIKKVAIDIDRLHRHHDSDSSFTHERGSGLTTYNFDSALRTTEVFAGSGLRVFYICPSMRDANNYYKDFVRFLQNQDEYSLINLNDKLNRKYFVKLNGCIVQFISDVIYFKTRPYFYLALEYTCIWDY